MEFVLIGAAVAFLLWFGYRNEQKQKKEQEEIMTNSYLKAMSIKKQNESEEDN